MYSSHVREWVTSHAQISHVRQTASSPPLLHTWRLDEMKWCMKKWNEEAAAMEGWSRAVALGQVQTCSTPTMLLVKYSASTPSLCDVLFTTHSLQDCSIAYSAPNCSWSFHSMTNCFGSVLFSDESLYLATNCSYAVYLFRLYKQREGCFVLRSFHKNCGLVNTRRS